MRASELSSSDEGPLWRVDLKDIVNDLFPKRRGLVQEVERRWLAGEIPMYMAASVFNVPLARFLFHTAGQNAKESDGRKRMMLPIISGGRAPTELQESWTIGLDVASVMVLAHLDLLEQALGAFHHVKLAPDLMELLFRERDETRFHQPSRIEAAMEVQKLENTGQVQVASDLITHPPDVLVNEVGFELATLLRMAERDDGVVVCVLPIYRLGSLMEQSADTGGHDRLIISTADVCNLLNEKGKIDAEDHRRAMLFFSRQGQTQRSDLTQSSLDGPVYVEDSALSYLQDAGILQSVAASGLDVRVHPNVLDHRHALIEEGDIGHKLGARIEQIRTVLRNAVDNGAASFLPRAADRDKRVPKRGFHFQATRSLLAYGTACDALCVDDRYINNRANFTGDANQLVPIVCVLDVLRHLPSQGVIDPAGHWTARHKLRRAGFAFLDVDADELVHWLKSARVVQGQMTESAELKTLRQAVKRADSLGVLSVKETMALSRNFNLAGKTAIARLWEDSSLTAEWAGTLSDWVWHNLMKTTVLALERFSGDNRETWIRDKISLRLGYLLLPATIWTSERGSQFSQWIERSVLRPLQPANSEVIEAALAMSCDAISSLKDQPEAHGNLFLEQLPPSARTVAITKNPDFSKRCGFSPELVFGIGTDIEVANNELVNAARKVFATNTEVTIQDASGKDVSVGIDSANQVIVLTWTDSDGTSQCAALRELATLSPNLDTRRNALRGIVDRVGATGPDLLYSHNDLESREPTDQEFAAVFAESTNGVAAVQSRLLQKLSHGLPIEITDVVPQEISYFESFCGPNPGTHKPEPYFREILIPYRQRLLARNLQSGLDICLLGALRDDLTPGEWLSDYQDDVVWDALAACRPKENPFSLLGALDVALYRQGDSRFKDFAAEAVTTLSDERFGREDSPDLYALLRILYDLVSNQINLLEGGAKYPGYWKRMCACMHAGFVARALSEASASIDLPSLEEWTRSHMAAAGDVAGFVDARDEPMFFAVRTTTQFLNIEILGRLRRLKSRHEREGREVPRSGDIDLATSRARDAGIIPALDFPGPLEGHRRPTAPVPQPVLPGLEEASANDTETFLLEGLVTASQLFALGEPELDRARNIVRGLPNEVNESNLKCLAAASVVAAANRDAMLADNIADAAARMAFGFSKGEDTHLLFQVMLQAATAHERHDTWFEWLEERLANISANLPPNECLEVFQDHLWEISRVLPVKSWFHLRASSIASSGMA